MELVLEFTFEAQLGEPLVPGAGPYGTRMVIPLTSGTVSGERINGTLAGSGADWALVGPDGWARVDVRGQILTDDGAVIFVTYGGVLELNEKVMVTMAAGDQETAFDDQYFRITPCLETGDARATRGSTRPCSSPAGGWSAAASCTRSTGPRERAPAGRRRHRGGLGHRSRGGGPAGR